MTISKTLLISCISSLAVFFAFNGNYAEAAGSAGVSSADSFNRFINANPSAQLAMRDVADKEEISAACMFSSNEVHRGITMMKNGSIYEWSRAETDADLSSRKLLKKDKTITDKIFNLRNTNGFDDAELEYHIDGTSYCYVRYLHGSKTKTIIWPRNEIMGKGKKVPESVKEIFNKMLSAAAVIQSEKNSQNNK